MNLEKYQIKSNEVIIDSDWTISSNRLTREDALEVRNRIYWLQAYYLKKLINKNWEILYIDPHDNRFWELTYPKSDMHGGGPPLLKNIDKDMVLSKYGKITP